MLQLNMLMYELTYKMCSAPITVKTFLWNSLNSVTKKIKTIAVFKANVWCVRDSRWYHCTTESQITDRILKFNTIQCFSDFSDSLNSLNSMKVLLHLRKTAMWFLQQAMTCVWVNGRELEKGFSSWVMLGPRVLQHFIYSLGKKIIYKFYKYIQDLKPLNNSPNQSIGVHFTWETFQLYIISRTEFSIKLWNDILMYLSPTIT